MTIRLSRCLASGVPLAILAHTTFALCAESPPPEGAVEWLGKHATIRGGMLVGELPLGSFDSWRPEGNHLAIRDTVTWTGGFVTGPDIGFKPVDEYQWFGLDVTTPLIFVPFDSALSSAQGAAFAPGLLGGVSFFSLNRDRPNVLTVSLGAQVPFISIPDDALVAKDARIKDLAGSCGSRGLVKCETITLVEYEANQKLQPIFILGVMVGVGL